MRLFLYKLLSLLLLIGHSFLATAQCENDTSPPLATCLSNKVLVGEYEVTPDLLNEGSTDDCTAPEKLEFRVAVATHDSDTIPSTTSITLPEGSGSYVVALWVIDEAGNATACWGDVRVMVEGECEEDTVAPSLTCLKSLQTLGDDVLLFAEDFIALVSDNCSERSTLSYGLELAENFSGTMPTEAILEFSTPGVYSVYVWVADTQGNSTYCKSQILISETLTVEGFVYNDVDQDCSRGVDEVGLNQSVRITVLEDNVPVYTIIEESVDGMFSAKVLKPTTANASVEVELANQSLPNCGQVNKTAIALTQETIQVEDIGVHLTEGCADLGVTIEGVHGDCEAEGLFVLQFYNIGSEATDPTITLEFANSVAISYIFASHSYEYEASEELTTYTFQLSNLLPGESGEFFFFGKQTCEFDNQTQVITASITADNACSNLWEGAEMRITKDCLGEEVKFKFENVGRGDMLAPINFIVIEDVIMMKQGTLQLPAGGSETLQFPASGSTYFAQVNQSTDYPWQATTSVVSEGCTVDQTRITTGIVEQLPLENTTPHIDVAVIAPEKATVNRLSALPIGIGAEHLLAANKPIEYVIEYSNEGTKVIEDLTLEVDLSEHLDISTLNLTYATHNTFERTINGNRVTFSFPNIALVSNSISEKEGSGVLKFTIQQLPDVATNTKIESKVNMQFDEETPLGSSIFHTVGALALSTSTREIFNTVNLVASPNPFSIYTTITFENDQNDWMQFELLDVNGTTVWEQQLNANQLRISRQNLHNGFYFYVLKKEGQPVGMGKLFVE